ncbi:heavy metal-binding domain-containing protein [Mucilaginibacter sp.]|uniref:heavy metal-binding domain-containing protein n=1 Tax=Mucilaginibacter sp. TaxID=1882438 RepID=UPI002624E327|nr:heavy metal-binding domain-containing protein [Mucilaginibacter sp.]MDB4919726.1 actP [Mucilaginibacter sp.]
MKKVTLMAIAILFSGMSVLAVHSTTLVSDTTKTKKVKPAKVQYTCPMHPDVLSDKPGKCPKPNCGMTLVKKEPAKKKAAK